MSEHAWSNRNLGIQLDTHAEVEFERRCGYLERASDISLVESVQKIIGWYGLFHDIQISLAFQQMLSLSAGVLGSNLITVDALN
jgi:hypothetical protein